MTQMKVDILDYMGKINDGVLTLISLMYEEDYYEGTFYYDKNNLIALTVERRLEEKIGCIIEEWPGYRELVLSIIKKIVPVEEIINRLDDIDLNKYDQATDINYIDSDESDSDDPEFTSATQSQ